MSDLEFDSALVFCPHPDDAEFLAGGSMAKWSSEGKEVRVVVVTDGSAGHNDPTVDTDWLVKTRKEEQRAASAILGVKDVIFLGYRDGYVEDSHELRRDMIREIRRHKPDLLVGLDPTTYYFAQRYINHPDHRKVGEAFLAAVNPGATTVPLYREELFDKGFEPHRVKYCLLGFSANPDYFIDITDFIDKKVAALAAHDSQMQNMDAVATIGDRVKEMGKMVAQASSLEIEYAEAFKLFNFHREEPDEAPLEQEGAQESEQED